MFHIQVVFSVCVGLPLQIALLNFDVAFYIRIQIFMLLFIRVLFIRNCVLQIERTSAVLQSLLDAPGTFFLFLCYM